MRKVFAFVGLILVAPAAAGQDPDAKISPRFGVVANVRLFPQGTPKAAVASAIKAVENGRFEYLVAHTLDEKFVETRVADRAKGFEVEAETDLRARRELQRTDITRVGTEEKLPADPKEFAAKVTAEARLRGFRAFVKEIQDRYTEDPLVLRELQRFVREGDFAVEGTTAKATLKDVKDRALYFTFLEGRWFVENRQADVKPAEKPVEKPTDK